MGSLFNLTVVALLPFVLSSHLFLEKAQLQHINAKHERHFKKAAGVENRLLEPLLKIRKGPALIEIPTTQNAIVECEASGNPPATIHWLKDGKKIPQSVYELTHSESSEEDPMPLLGIGLTRSRLFVDCAGARDEGLYTCVAENVFNKASRTIAVNVIDNPLDDQAAICLAKKPFSSVARINMWTDNRLELIGSDVKLFCRSEGFPMPETTWFGPNNIPVDTNSEKFKMLENGDLIIHNIEWSDMGDYTCQVQNLYGLNSTRTFLYPTEPDPGAEV